MREGQDSRSPSQELARKAVALLLQENLVRSRDMDEIANSLAVGSATPDMWRTWIDLAFAEDGSNE
jgi:hypothetical protein